MYIDRNWNLTHDGPGFYLPLPVALVIALALGGLFAVFLPFIGFALCLQAVWGRVLQRKAPRTSETTPEPSYPRC